MNMLVNPVAGVEANSSLVNRFAGLLVGPLSGLVDDSWRV
jgi:hypothetical protein